jgi:cytochrome c biogenesis protein CcdA
MRAHQVERSSLLLGAGIIAIELPTAFPYFAVIAALVGSDVNAMLQLSLLVLFNVLFVAPLLAILLLRQISGAQAVQRLKRLRDSLHRRMGILLPLVALVVGLVLLTVGGIGLADS